MSPSPVGAAATEEPRDPASGAAPQLWGRETWLGIGLGIALLLALASFVDFRAVWREVARCDARLAGAGLLAHYATYVVRGARWRRTLRHLHGRAGTWAFALLVFFYNFVDNVVPAKLGDFYAAHLARINFGVPRSAALGSIVFGRMIDAWVLLASAALAAGVVFADRLPEGVIWALGFGAVAAAAATAILLAAALAGRYPAGWLPRSLSRRLESFRSGMLPRPREAGSIAALTAAIWSLEALWMLLLARAFAIHLGPWELLFVTTVPLLASAFPLTPSGAGVVELSLYGCFRALGVPAPLAVSMTVLNRFIDFWLHIGLGIVAWSLRRRLRLRTWSESPPCRPAALDDLRPAAG